MLDADRPGLSRIEAAWLESDQRSFWAPCPHCGEYQVLRWERLFWPKGEPQNAHYQCEHCSGEIQDWQKRQMLKPGEWRPANPESSRGGLWMNALYSPWRKWGALARKFLQDQKSQETLREFVNTVPAGGLFLTAAADVQKDRIEVQLVA